MPAVHASLISAETLPLCKNITEYKYTYILKLVFLKTNLKNVTKKADLYPLI